MIRSGLSSELLGVHTGCDHRRGLMSAKAKAISSRLLGKQSRHPTTRQRCRKHEAQRCARVVGADHARFYQLRNYSPRLTLAGSDDCIGITTRQFAPVQQSFRGYFPPWVATFTTVGRARIMAGQDLMEYICQEDNFDPQHIPGPAKGPGGAQ